MYTSIDHLSMFWRRKRPEPKLDLYGATGLFAALVSSAAAGGMLLYYATKPKAVAKEKVENHPVIKPKPKAKPKAVLKATPVSVETQTPQPYSYMGMYDDAFGDVLRRPLTTLYQHFKTPVPP